MTERNTVGVPPRLHYDATGIDALPAPGTGGPAIMAIAHNGGDSLAAVRSALDHGAVAIEIDVTSIAGELRALHDEPNPFGGRFTRSPTLGAAWSEAATAKVVVLDLKSASSGFARSVAGFLDRHRGPEIVVVAGETELLEMIHQHRPATELFLGVASDAALRRVLDGSASSAVPLAGVSVRHDLLDVDTVSALHALGLRVGAWTVNEPARVAELGRIGVESVSTDNLAILSAGAARA